MRQIALGRVADTFYRNFPSGALASGDIFRDLPTFGLLASSRTAGIVITPACDLAQSKTPTATFLPIVSISEYLTMPDCRRRLVASHHDTLAPHCDRDPLSLQNAQLLEAAENAVRMASEKQRQRLTGLANYLRGIRDGDLASSNRGFLDAQTDKAARTELSRLINNGYADSHFMPAPSGDIVAFMEPSLALFRYPQTVTCEILEKANELEPTLSRDLWEREADSIAPHVRAQFPTPPLRCHTLESQFLAELATRFASLYVRIGSPDLSAEARDSIISQITNAPAATLESEE